MAKGFLFDRLEKLDGDKRTRLGDVGFALYFLEPAALNAAEEIFCDFDAKRMMPFVFLPFDKTCLEWRSDAGYKLCLSMENNEVEFIDTGARVPSINMTVAIESPDSDETYFASAWFARDGAQHGSFQWAEDQHTNRNGGYADFGRHRWARIIATMLFGLAFINSPNLHEAEKVDVSKLNKKRLQGGKLPLSEYTTIRPNAHTKQWVRETQAERGGSVSEHWVKAHLHTYLTGPGRHRAVVKLLAPFQRGNPEVGTREQRYKVTAASEEVKL